MDILKLSPEQLRRAADLREKIDALQRELEAIGGASAAVAEPTKVHWTQTAAGRAKLARAARNSWRTGRRSSKPTGAGVSHGQRLPWTQTPEGRAKLEEIRKRWPSD